MCVMRSYFALPVVFFFLPRVKKRGREEMEEERK